MNHYPHFNFSFSTGGAKLYFLLLLFALGGGMIQAQQNSRSYVNPVDERGKPLPLLYLGPATGIYTYSGLAGVTLEAPITPRLSIFAAGGLGGWGYKAGGGLQLYLSKDQFGSAIGIGYSNAFGGSDLELEMELEDGSNRMVLLDLYDAGTLNFTYNYHFHLGDRSKFVLGTGYALAVVDTPYRLTSPANAQLSLASRQVMQIMQPGGLILSISFLFAVD